MAKVARPEGFVASVRGLGARSHAAIIAATVVALELAVPLSAVVGFNKGGAMLVVVLGTSFAAVGASAAVRRLEVPCHCFGSRSTRLLGWRQVALLPIWVLGAYSLAEMPTSSGARRLDVAVIVGFALIVPQSIACARHFRRARADRHAYLGG
jgi:hypothetical protein